MDQSKAVAMQRMSDEQLLIKWQETTAKMRVYAQRALSVRQPLKERNNHFGAYLRVGRIVDALWTEIQRRMDRHAQNTDEFYDN